mmetsp:Transcript_8574/g.10843  ORF Transcript_8574/g.10843 Transcript_8574/m.10843 type:complete len:135 (+) Transcript_8574:489-893(+)
MFLFRQAKATRTLLVRGASNAKPHTFVPLCNAKPVQVLAGTNNSLLNMSTACNNKPAHSIIAGNILAGDSNSVFSFSQKNLGIPSIPIPSHKFSESELGTVLDFEGSSVIKKRRKKMNKHKLKKRRKLNRRSNK